MSVRKSTFVPNILVERCTACEKPVYAMEKADMNDKPFHKSCLRCSQCKCQLTPKNFAANSGKMFCTSHFKQLFKMNGNYDEGFGRQQHKTEWNGK
ncbi:hypothetical protein LOTGIDRAFT_182048 [Lottia gigantea]|uniref:LIM zinc-binding domain-containing protein n=1 Tax=Lottia gigantea TaxID=225164 RepID=V4AJC6_LOTGI|nr:hypothetical protein LOTGIDRAFT_182048 [Lottia gigantea]ESO93656.1 hypothetical protein LOTGIDRAFT_182048 [Lottia gigantea]